MKTLWVKVHSRLSPMLLNDATLKDVVKEGQWKLFYLVFKSKADNHSIRATQLWRFCLQGSRQSSTLKAEGPEKGPLISRGNELQDDWMGPVQVFIQPKPMAWVQSYDVPIYLWNTHIRFYCHTTLNNPGNQKPACLENCSKKKGKERLPK